VPCLRIVHTIRIGRVDEVDSQIIHGALQKLDRILLRRPLRRIDRKMHPTIADLVNVNLCGSELASLHDFRF
jgi:hypothetical protein